MNTIRCEMPATFATSRGGHTSLRVISLERNLRQTWSMLSKGSRVGNHCNAHKPFSLSCGQIGASTLLKLNQASPPIRNKTPPHGAERADNGVRSCPVQADDISEKAIDSYRFCDESVPFYQRLTKGLSGQSRIHVVAVLPHSGDENKQYLKDKMLAISDVRRPRQR
jgi:hypothetical protein